MVSVSLFQEENVRKLKKDMYILKVDKSSVENNE